MAIGERLKMARQVADLSQRALAEEAGISAMAVSKYERDLDLPSSGVLIRLAAVLGVKVEYFLRPVTVRLSTPVYRRRASLPRKQEKRILAQTQDWLERYLDAEMLFETFRGFSLSKEINRSVNSLEDVERVVLDLRQVWKLGLDPIDSLVGVLEDKGIKVGLLEAHDDFDALTLWVNQTTPVIMLKKEIPGDRQRFNLAHELGHLILEPVAGVDAERAVHRFAGAFLVPKPVAQFELGEQRKVLGIPELLLLKHKYGLSMQAWIYRAWDLGIISKPYAARLFMQFRQQGWQREEPGVQIPPEEPGRLNHLVLRALAEGIISRARAGELMGMSISEHRKREAGEYEGLPVAVCR